MAKSKSILISGNPYVEMREARGGESVKLRLVYILGNTIEVDEEGKRAYRQQRKQEKTDLWLWNKKHLTPAESEHNRVTKETAKVVRETREREFLSKSRGYKFAADRNKINLFEWFEDYIAEYDKADKRVVQLSLKRFRDFVQGSRRYALFSKCIHPDQLTPELIEDFVARLEKDCVGEGAHTLYKRFKKMVTAATKQGVFVENPCEGITAKVEDEGRLKKDVLTAAEITRLLQCRFDRQSEDVRRAFIFSLFTGLRFCDVKELRYRNINYEECTLTFQQQKTRRTNNVPLRPDILALVGEGEPDGLIFHLPSPTACNKSLQHWVSRAGINKHITWHCGRHSFATSLLNNGVNIKVVSSLLGHSTLRFTEIYLRAVDKQKVEAINTLPNLNIE